MLERYQEGLPQDLRVVDLVAELGELEARYAAPEAAMFLATVSSAAAGCVVVKRFDARTAEIKRLYVDPEFRGHGAARALMESAVAFARELGCERVALDTERDRLRPAYELYRSLGFVPLTCHFRMPARCRHLPRHRTRAGSPGYRGRR